MASEVFGKAKFLTTDFSTYYNPDDKVWGKKPDQKADLPEQNGLPVFVKDFKIKEPAAAMLYFTALGCCDVYINGRRVGNDEMKPGWTDYSKRTLYCTYDVSSLITKGDNRILAVVSPGWCCGRISGGRYKINNPAFMACLTNGAKAIVTDKTWSAAVCGQIRTADIWDGEFCDGTLPSYAQMSLPSFTLEGFSKPAYFSYRGEITPYIGTTVRVRDGLSLAPQKITVSDGVDFNSTDFGVIHICEENASLPVTVRKGQSVTVDFGQEITGWVKAGFRGVNGTTVKMVYSEFLNDSGSKDRGNDGPEGSVYTINLRSALAKAYYRIAGMPDEIYRPTFAFFGFRYVELTADNDFEIVNLTAEVVGNDNEETGHIETSDPMVNKLISNIIWGQRGNYLSVPTDCPQRDERLGWTGDAQAFSTTAAYNADVYSFFRKWMQDMRDSQGKKGEYSDVNPVVEYCKANNAAAWGDAGVIIPYNMYQMFGDTTLISEHFDSMDKYILGLIKTNRYKGPHPRYGDWLSYDYCKNDMISSAFLVHDLDMMIEMATALGKSEKAEEYKDHREKAYKYFCRKYMKKGKPRGSTQTDKVLALAFDLADEMNAKQIADELEKQIAENGNRLTTGFVGTYNLCPTLSKYGKDKMAYNLLLQRNEPSWLYSVDQGATTIWERWNSYTKEKGFGDVGMNSFNHYAYGAIGEWMFRYMAGIVPAEPGFRKLTLAPKIDSRTADELPDGQSNITYVSASYRSANGLIKSEWNTVNGLKYFCSVPVDTTLVLPVKQAGITINGISHSADEFENENGCIKIALTKGEYMIIEEATGEEN